jgi:glycosyltransferase involved in cell wall biosynthesis
MAKKYKIAIDISPTVDGNAVRGVGYYTSNLVKSLQQHTQKHRSYSHFKIDLITDPTKLKQEPYDLIHYPYFDPFKLTLPRSSQPVVVTVHDLIPIQFKNQFPPGLRGKLKWQIQKRALRQVDSIITVSHYSKKIISQIIKYPQENIFPIYEGADNSFKPITDTKILKTVKNKYSLPDKFVLFVGDINWNKNIPNLVKACRRLKYPLVIVGSSAVKKDVPNHPWTKDIRWLQAQAKKRRYSKSLILTGFVSDEDLPVIYNLATIYCQPSFAEGFGLPLVQAMQSGCPVAFSRDTSLPEVVGEAGLSFNPRSIPDITSVLKKYWLNPKLRHQYRQLGLNRAKLFKWSDTAKQTLAVYQSLLAHEK